MSDTAAASVNAWPMPYFGVAGSHPIASADNGACCAINSAGRVVEIHTNGSNLYYCLGQAAGAELTWQAAGIEITVSSKTTSGYNPSVVVDNSGYVLEADDTGGIDATINYRIGQVSGNTINWTTLNHYTKGYTPSMCINASGSWVECHSSNELGTGDMWTTVGTFKNGAFSYEKSVSMKNDGVNPSIAVNNNNVVVQVHDNNAGKLYYMLGQLTMSGSSPSGISWTSSSTEYDSGDNPTVVITDDNMVYELHSALPDWTTTEQVDGLWQRVGQIQFTSGKPTSITWLDYFGQGSSTTPKDSYAFDRGNIPWIACNQVLNGAASTADPLAVSIHQGSNAGGPESVYGTASIVFDRRLWMADNRTTLQTRTLGQTVVPGAHDASMYMGLSANILQDAAKTQSLDITGQLMAGVRWFDLRVMLVNDPSTSSSTFYMHHNFVRGPLLSDVLSQIQIFMNATPGEFVILKVSHYGAETDGGAIPSKATFTQADLNSLCSILTQSLGTWACPSPPTGARLASTALQNIWNAAGTVLIVCDGDTQGSNPLYVTPGSYKGVFNYRDWYAPDPQMGDLNVFDLYSDTIHLDTMMISLAQDTNVTSTAMPDGQQPKFEGGNVTSGWSGGDPTWGGFNGVCQYPGPNNTQVPCDLFLLSWTLTTDPVVFVGAWDANSVLANSVTSKGPNKWGQTLGILYNDYVQSARSADVAYRLNGF